MKHELKIKNKYPTLTISNIHKTTETTNVAQYLKRGKLLLLRENKR